MSLAAMASSKPAKRHVRDPETFNLVKVARIDAHGPTREALVRSGWIDDRAPLAEASGD